MNDSGDAQNVAEGNPDPGDGLLPLIEVEDDPFGGSEPFSLDDYRRNKRAYLNQADPERIRETADITDDSIEYLELLGEQSFAVAVGDEVSLRVRTLPNAPVTFQTIDGGYFRNNANTVTVDSSAAGTARAVYFCDRGTVGSVTVLAASPVARGRVQFSIQVLDPAGDRDPENAQRVESLRERYHNPEADRPGPAVTVDELLEQNGIPAK